MIYVACAFILLFVLTPVWALFNQEPLQFKPYISDVGIDMGDLDLALIYCSCGSPDPLEHLKTCVMALPIPILREVEALCD